jgi:Calx-beta domain
MSNQLAAFTIAAAAMALALFGSASARAAIVTSPSAQAGSTTATIGAGATIAYRGRQLDNTVDPNPGVGPVLCPGETTDPDDLTCGHLGIDFTASGTGSATVTFPADQSLLALMVCQPQLVDANPTDRCSFGTDIALVSETYADPDPVTLLQTLTVTFVVGPGCTTGSPCHYELVIIPTFVGSLSILPDCPPNTAGDTALPPATPCIDYTGTVALAAAGGGGGGQGGGTVDPPVSIIDSAAREGDTGASAMTFLVGLGWKSSVPVTVNYLTADNSATTGDYMAAAGAVVFLPGETVKTVTVNVLGDTARESNETFFVQLALPQPSAFVHIERGKATGRISNDDYGHTATAYGRLGSAAVAATVRENGSDWIQFADGRGFRFWATSITSATWNDLLGTATVSGRALTNGVYQNFTATIQHSMLGDQFKLTLADGRSFGGVLTSGKTTYEE